MRCEEKACPHAAVPGRRFCEGHRHQEPSPAPVDPDSFVVSCTEVFAPRTNEVATSLLRAVKSLSEGNALKVRIRKFSKPTLYVTQRYAQSEGLQVGLRFPRGSEWAYFWKMTPEQIAARAEKAERISVARSKKKAR